MSDIHYEQKLVFAEQLLRNNDDPFKAAFASFPDDAGFALQIASPPMAWQHDAIVIAHKEKLLASTDAKDFLPSKEQQAKDIYLIATSTVNSPEDRLKAHRLYAEVMGHIEKQPQGGGVNILTQGVMIVPAHRSDTDWEKDAIKQQQLLTQRHDKPTIVN